MEKEPITQEMPSKNNTDNIELEIDNKKQKLFGLTEEELAELDEKDPKRYWDN